MKTSFILITIILLITGLIMWKGEDIVTMVTKPKYTGEVSPYDDIIQKYAEMYNLDPMLIRAVIRQESNWQSDVIGFDGKSIGLMQITKPLAHDFFYTIGMVYNKYDAKNPDVKFSDFSDPDINIRIGAWKLSNDLKYYSGDLEKTLEAYNEGRGNVNNGIDDTVYSDSVLAYYNSYKGETS